MAREGLLERGPELDELNARMEKAAAGDGSVVLVEGPAGIGKSRLLAEARRHAERSIRVLPARGSELEREFPFGLVRQLFEAELATPERRERLLAGAAAPAAQVFADLTTAEDGDGASFAALHGLYWLALNLAEEGPLLLAVDDLHWCDRPSLLFAAYLARRLEGQPILLLAGVRTRRARHRRGAAWRDSQRPHDDQHPSGTAERRRRGGFRRGQARGGA